MGLQTWPPSKLPLSSMACLDVEPPTICRVLQRRLQQRRTREQLVEQGIMPRAYSRYAGGFEAMDRNALHGSFDAFLRVDPFEQHMLKANPVCQKALKMPAAFHEQIRSLERARTGNFLKHKLCRRPVRSELVRMHILQAETQAEPSLQATQMRLKRARLADDLNEKISQRPGPMELVVKNILPVDNSVKEVIEEKMVNRPETVDVYNFDEDSSNAKSPEQPSSQASQHACSASPKEAVGSEAVSPSPPVNSATQQSSPIPQVPSNSFNIVTTNEQQNSHLVKVPPTIATVAPTVRGPFLVKQSQPKASGDKSRSKKSKEPKPRVKKLKYHQYVPPDQKQEASEVPMDSAYARLLQQQQQFLQLQILSQQQQHYNYQAILPAPLCQGNSSCSDVVPSRNGLSTMDSLTNAAPSRPSPTLTNRTSAHLPPNLEEMKVAELKQELKQRGLLVSGTKTDLIERLKAYGETFNIQPASAMEVAQTENVKLAKLSPPVSPIVSKVSSLGLEECLAADGHPSAPTPPGVSQEDSGVETRASERDKRLLEKECQIEELKRKLEHEQKLVEELKMQLEVEKRSQPGGSSHSPPAPVQVKEENRGFSNPTDSCCSAVVKQEEVMEQNHQSPPQQLFIGHPGPPILLAGSMSESTVTVHLPHNGVKVQATVSSATPCLVQATAMVPQKTETTVALEQQYFHSLPMTEQTAQLSIFPGSRSQLRANLCEAVGAIPRPLNTVLQSGGPAKASCSQDVITRPTQKAKDPPRYEDAVKHSRSRQIVSQVPTATSQHMDDLFDVLIESGEIPPFIGQDPPYLDKLFPVTASVTTLPVNTVLSRPPPQIQVARPPAPSLNPAPSAVPPATAVHHLERLLEGTQSRPLQDPPTTPTDGMELDFNDNALHSGFHLQNTHLDNMDWLDLTIPVAEEVANRLDMSFSSDFLDSHELQLHWA